jgi:Rrf2 family protein
VLALTKKTSYGLIALTHLARKAGRLISAREIAEHSGVPTALLMNVLKELASAGYLDSVRGAHGGYRLARSPAEINLADMVAALEGPIRMADCVLDHSDRKADHACEAMGSCPVADPVHRVHRKLRDFLRNVTLAEILDPAGADADLKGTVHAAEAAHLP